MIFTQSPNPAFLYNSSCTLLPIHLKSLECQDMPRLTNKHKGKKEQSTGGKKGRQGNTGNKEQEQYKGRKDKGRKSGWKEKSKKQIGTNGRTKERMRPKDRKPWDHPIFTKVAPRKSSQILSFITHEPNKETWIERRFKQKPLKTFIFRISLQRKMNWKYSRMKRVKILTWASDPLFPCSQTWYQHVP